MNRRDAEDAENGNNGVAKKGTKNREKDRTKGKGGRR